MTRILLVATVHEELGLASVLTAQHAILERGRPDVIFLEIPPDVFHDFEAGIRSNLESRAARQYREDNDIALVPVDLTTPDESFFKDIQYLDRRLSTTSSAYRRLIDQHSYDVAAYGFPYLNSHRCSSAWSDIYAAMHAGIQHLSRDTRLREIFERWRHTNALRDSAMLSSIADYCSRSPFKNGVLLIGAAHRQSILEKSGRGHEGNTLQISPALLGDLDLQ